MKKRLLAILLSFSMIFSMTACFNDYDDYDDYGDYDEDESLWDILFGDDIDEENAKPTPTQIINPTQMPQSTQGSSEGVKPGNVQNNISGSQTSVSMTVDDVTGLNVNRVSRNDIVPMGSDGTWSVFVYLCGSDLETDNGLATLDMAEMKKASTDSRIKFIVQTGGAKKWDSSVKADKFQRYVISEGKQTLVDEQPGKNMGESSALIDFLNWSITNYPAKNMGLILWNHGGGSISGVCFDEKNNYDSLTLRELDMALLSVHDKMTDDFEFIGFDACLMATVETANILASYARYMYASEETEPGYGWDYTEIGKYLNNNKSADGASLGKVVADSFYESCKADGSQNEATFSIVDLSKMDKLLQVFNDYSKELYEATEENATYSEAVRSIKAVDNFGGNNKIDGYTNMVDMAGIVEAGSKYSTKGQAVINAINETVVYVRNGSLHKNACGLSMYYPLSVQGSNELSTYGEIAISPYYLAFVDRGAQGAVNEGNLFGYDFSNLFDFWGMLSYFFDDDGYGEEENNGYDEYWAYYDDYETTGESPYIDFEVEPQLFDDGSYGFVLTEEALNNTASVQANVYVVSDDEEDLIELGISVDIWADWETGEFYDNFDGLWFSLPDGQNLAVYIEYEGAGYDVYTSPVMINGEEYNLRIVHDYEQGDVYIESVVSGIDEYGMASRDNFKLSKGDVIVPLYYAYAIDSDDEYYYEGYEYIYDGDTTLWFDYLPDGEYLYGFYIDDVFGDYYTTDYTWFTIEDGEIYFDDEEESDGGWFWNLFW